MAESHPSIFNHVIGPIMRGPSSSHTAASVRIGLLAKRLLGESPRRVVVTFDPDGSLATTYMGQGSAMGLAGGLLGLDIADPDLVNSLHLCQERGLELSFCIESIGAVHPNTYSLELIGGHGKTITCVALSTGGGIIRLVELDGRKVVDDAAYVNPLLPVAADTQCVLPFATCEELEKLAETEDGPLSNYALAHETALGNVSSARVLDLARSHLHVMKKAVTTGLAGTKYSDRLLPRQSHLIGEAEKKAKLIPASLCNTIIANVTAVMETKSAMGVIVAAPTAGSCGTLAGSLVAVSDLLGKTEEDMARALLSAGLVGVCIARQGGFAAEEGGCQYECGAASGMTAAALVELMGGEAITSLHAAAMAMQNTMGLICDPVADRVEVPCLGKNIMAALNGLAAANMALAGFAHVVPLNQVIRAMKEVGDGMDRRFCCTCKGGLSITPEAKRIHSRLTPDIS